MKNIKTLGTILMFIGIGMFAFSLFRFFSMSKRIDPLTPTIALDEVAYDYNILIAGFFAFIGGTMLKYMQSNN